jgi:hypothetical protein
MRSIPPNNSPGVGVTEGVGVTVAVAVLGARQISWSVTSEAGTEVQLSVGVTRAVSSSGESVGVALGLAVAVSVGGLGVAVNIGGLYAGVVADGSTAAVASSTRVADGPRGSRSSGGAARSAGDAAGVTIGAMVWAWRVSGEQVIVARNDQAREAKLAPRRPCGGRRFMGMMKPVTLVR